jgi:Fe-S-cluster containining protein
MDIDFSPFFKKYEELVAMANTVFERVKKEYPEYRIKKKAYKDFKAGKKEDDILTDIAEKRIRCPLLNEQNLCDMYEYRPITCRLYGIPTTIGGSGHTCGKSGFVKGKQYPTVNMDILQNNLYKISKMADMLVPLSTTLLTDYNEEYFGLKTVEKDSQKE